MENAHLNKSRKDKFRLTLSIPEILKDYNRPVSDRTKEYINLGTLQWSVHGTVVPKISIPSVNVPFSTQVAKVTSYSRPAYDPISVKFVVDNNFNNYWFIQQWLNRLNEEREGIYNNKNIKNANLRDNFHDYMTTVSIDGLDEYNKPVIRWTYYKCLPVALTEIDWSYQDPEELEATFTFEINQMKSELLDI